MKLERVFPALLLVVLFGQLITSISRNAPTCDEYSHHIASGYSYLITRDFRMNPGSPPFPRMLSALPLLVLGAKAPLDHASWIEGNIPEFSKQFFNVYNNRMDLFIFWARMPFVLLSLLFGWLVFAWARQLFGYRTALFALVLYVFSPDILAHSGLATADLAVAFSFTLAFYFFWKFLKKEKNGKYLYLSAAATGLAFLSKFTAILLPPLLLAILLASGKKGLFRWHKFFLATGICLVTIWAGYFFEIKPLLQSTPDPPKKVAFLKELGGERLVSWGEKAPIPLASFTSGLGSMLFTRARGINAYLLGEWSRDGWWYYYFVAFAVKNTPPLLILFCSFFLLYVFRRNEFTKMNRLTAAFIFIPIAAFFILTMKDKAQAGIRYFLPVYPLVFFLAAAAASFLWQKKKMMKILIVALLLWHALEAIAVHPHHLAYFNQIAGGSSNGYKFLRDSNVDWGQGLKELGEWSKRAGYEEVVVDSICPVNPAVYGISYRHLREGERSVPAKTVYAVGVHFLDHLEWARGIKPDHIIGHSIFIYDRRNREA